MDHLRHSAESWREGATEPSLDERTRLRLAAMSGQMEQDMVTARRAALVDLLAGGGVYDRETIWETIEAQLGEPCWGKRPQETLWRDLRVLRRGGVRIAYSRRSGAVGYYLQHPALEAAQSRYQKQEDTQSLIGIRNMSPAAKVQQAFNAAAFALEQKRLVLAEQHPQWNVGEIDSAARRLVYGQHEELFD